MVVLDLRDWGDGNNWFASLQLALSGKARPTSIPSIPCFWEPAVAASFEIPFAVRVYRDFFEYNEPNVPRVHRAYPPLNDESDYHPRST
jgi:hypothetical protein